MNEDTYKTYHGISKFYQFKLFSVSALFFKKNTSQIEYLIFPGP